MMVYANRLRLSAPSFQCADFLLAAQKGRGGEICERSSPRARRGRSRALLILPTNAKPLAFSAVAPYPYHANSVPFHGAA